LLLQLLPTLLLLLLLLPGALRLALLQQLPCAGCQQQLDIRCSLQAGKK
jgi:hypothetical protein